MSTAFGGPILALRHELDTIRGNWFWFVILGICLIVLGTIALGSLAMASIATVMVFGWFLVIGGILEVVGCFWCKEWTGALLELLSGVLSVIVGLLFLSRPVTGTLALTLLFASFLLVGGILKVVTAIWYRYDAWVWLLLSGVIDAALGLMIWQSDPATALQFIGLLLGISLIFRGVTWIMIGLRVKKIPKLGAARAST